MKPWHVFLGPAVEALYGNGYFSVRDMPMMVTMTLHLLNETINVFAIIIPVI